MHQASGLAQLPGFHPEGGNMLYFGFGIAPSMFPTNCIIKRSRIGITRGVRLIKAMDHLGKLVSCLNPSHRATIAIMRERFGIGVEIPVTAPKVTLGTGDMILVMGVSGLPRLEGRHEYTRKEAEGAKFMFSLFTVNPVAKVVYA